MSGFTIQAGMFGRSPARQRRNSGKDIRVLISAVMAATRFSAAGRLLEIMFSFGKWLRNLWIYSQKTYGCSWEIQSLHLRCHRRRLQPVALKLPKRDRRWPEESLGQHYG